MPEPNDLAEGVTIFEVGHGDTVFQLVRSENSPHEHETQLGWHAGTARRVGDDIETPAGAVGPVIDAPRKISGVERFFEERLTVLEVIERYGKLVVARRRDRLQELQKSEDDPGELLRRIEVFGTEGTALEAGDPESITDTEGREHAAAEILRHSVDGLVTLPMHGTLLGAGERFYAEIEEAATVFPGVVLRLLYEDARAKWD